MIVPRGLQILSCSLGISLFVWASSNPRFRDVEGYLEGEFCLPVALGVGLMMLGYAVRGRYNKSAFWFALALVGQAAALQMIEAGPWIRYQHYSWVGRLFMDQPVPLMFLALQTSLVVWGLKFRWRSIQRWINHNFRTWQLLGVGLIFFATSATVSREVSAYVTELFLATVVQVINLGNILLIIWGLPEHAFDSVRQRCERLFGQAGEERRGESRGVDPFVVLAAIWVTVLAALLSFFIYERYPHIQDEVIYLYHARYLAEGMLTTPAPPVPEAFSIYMIPYESARWYSIFPPGWPAMLALGVLLGVPWLINPVLAGLNVLLAYFLVREIYCLRTARLTVLLLCISPWYLFMGMNFMAHTFALTCALVASLGVVRARKRGRAIWGWLGGSAAGMLSLIRPLDGLIMAGLLGLWAIGIGGRRLNAPSVTAFVLGFLVLGSVVLPYNKHLTGDPVVFPLTAYYDKYYGSKSNAYGFGPERGLGWPIDPFPGHSPLDALINANLNTFSINVELFGWSTGSLIFVALFLFSGATQRSDYLMLAAAAAVSGAYSLYWFSGGPDFGARYWFLMVVPLVALTARGIQFVEGTLHSKIISSNNKNILVLVAILSLSVFTLVNYVPWRAIDKYHHYLGMRPDIRELSKEYDFGKSIVLIRGDEHPDYQSAWANNPLNPYADEPVYAWDRNPEVRALVLNAYPNRSIWIVDGPSITHAGFKVVQGPLFARDLLPKGKRQTRIGREFK